MSYIGINPHKNIEPFLSARLPSSYPQAVLNEIKLLSFNKKDGAKAFGSFIFRLQKYPGDIDLVEIFKECCSEDEVITKFERSLKRIVNEIKRKRTHYFSEVKAGLDKRYDIDVGILLHGVYIPSPDLLKYSDKLFKNNMLTSEEYLIIKYILNKHDELDSNDYDSIYNIYREHKILRWTPEEILSGKKLLLNNEIKLLKDALKDHSPVKIDQLVLLGGRFIEVTNFLELAVEKDGQLKPINIDLEKEHNINIQLPQEIEKLYFSDYYYSPFKMIKRMYSLARHNNDLITLYKVLPFVSSNTSLLYQLKSEIDTLVLILERIKYPAIKSINKQLDDMKNKLASVLEINEDFLFEYNNYINKIITNNNRLEKIEMLKNLSKEFKRRINEQTIKYLIKIEMNPPPYYLLPPEQKYKRITREPYENPENPLKKYKEIIKEMIEE